MAGGGAKHSTDLGTVTLKTFEPGPTALVIWDTRVKGFGLRTRGKADKASWRWIYKYKHLDGSQTKLTLGSPVAGMTATEARALAREAQDARKYADKDVRSANVRALEDAAEKRRADAEAQAARENAALAESSRPTIETLWTRYWDAEGKFKKAAKGYEQLWNNHLKPSFGTIKVADLTVEALEDFKAARVETPGACNRALALLSIMMTKAVAWGWRRGCAPEHPVKGGMVKRYAENKVDFAFTSDELGAIFEAADKYGTEKHGGERSGGEAVGLIFRMLATTGARASEVLRAHWGQFAKQPDGRLLWIVEATNTKGGRAITRSLDPELARRLLEWNATSLAITAQPKVLELGGPRWVFPNARDSAKPVPRVENAWQKIKKDAGLTRT